LNLRSVRIGLSAFFASCALLLIGLAYLYHSEAQGLPNLALLRNGTSYYVNLGTAIFFSTSGHPTFAVGTYTALSLASLEAIHLVPYVEILSIGAVFPTTEHVRTAYIRQRSLFAQVHR